jgi:beta-ribofuranosylaminobenzene 5'-phosphate synthase
MPIIRVQTPSRLHFGLFRVPESADFDELAGRRYGGIGLMVNAPGLRLSAHPAQEWSAEGTLGDRALAFARQFADTFPPNTFAPLHFVVEQAPPEHVGLGSGTQLGLAVARALTYSIGQNHLDVFELARRIGRGARSAVGVYGFERGGFVMDAGNWVSAGVAPLPVRFAFPEEWPLVLVTPKRQPGLYGAAERRAFQVLEGLCPNVEQTDSLRQLLLLNLIPALVAKEFLALSEALYDFNARVGETFASVQGGAYANTLTAEVVTFLRRRGIRGVGQSSWGPTAFAIFENVGQAEELMDPLRRHFTFDANELILTRACNRGATVIA